MKFKDANLLQDLLRAFRKLDPKNKYTKQAIMAFLGVELQTSKKNSEEIVQKLEPTISSEETSRSPEFKNLGTAVDMKISGVETQSQDITQMEVEEAIPSILTLSKSTLRWKPKWAFKVVPLAPSMPGKATEPSGLEPIFQRKLTRSILKISLSIPRDSGCVNLREVIEKIAKGEVLRTLPRLSELVLAPRIQLLLDRSDGMMPFLQDLRKIQRDIRRLVCDGSLEVLGFSCCPSRGTGKGYKRTWKRYYDHYTPLPGSKVVCVTDLGIGDPPGSDMAASPEEWIIFDDYLRRASCFLFVFVPYSSSRWPKELVRKMSILHWDHRTNASHAARVVRSEISARKKQ